MKHTKTSLRLLQIEIVITGTAMAMPIMVPFYHSIGMDQGQIGLSQAIFTAALLLINIPTGWIADRFSRRMSNAIGDLGCALALLYYAQASGFGDVVVAEIIFGISLAFSQGADNALLRAYAQLLDSSGKLFLRQNSLLASWQPIAQIIALAIGGVIGASDPRLAIALSAIPYFAGSLLSLFVKEQGEWLVSQHKNPLRDMVRVTRASVGTDPHLRWLIIGHGIGREITHVMVWALTPLLLFAGVPLGIVAIGWIVNSLTVVVGARIAGWISPGLREWQRFVIPMVVAIVGLVIMSIHLSLITIWLYALIGLAQGWTAAVLLPMVQNRAPAGNQATVISIAKSISHLLYIPLVWIIGLAGNIDVRLTMVATIIIFTPMVIVVGRRLYRLENK
jgi:MFS family permease